MECFYLVFSYGSHLQLFLIKEESSAVPLGLGMCQDKVAPLGCWSLTLKMEDIRKDSINVHYED